jgi:Fur family transcriptional regulator, iron response regulator
MPHDAMEKLRQHGIAPTAQRVVIAEYILSTDAHPTADQVWAEVQKRIAVVSRATVYNTLNLFVEKGLIRSFALTEGKQVFDPNTSQHHHFIDDETGVIHDVPWSALKVEGVEGLTGVDVAEYQVVLRGRRSKRGRR